MGKVNAVEMGMLFDEFMSAKSTNLSSVNSKDNTKDELEKPDSWTIVNALNYVVQNIKDSKLDKEKFWDVCEEAIDYLVQALSLSKWQVLFVAIMSELGKPLTWHDFASYVGCTRLSIMGEAEEMDALVKMRWVETASCHREEGWTSGFILVEGAVAALSRNKPFVPEKLDGMDEITFMRKLQFHVNRMMAQPMEVEKEKMWLCCAAEANPTLPFCQEVLSWPSEEVKIFLMMMAADYANLANTEREGVSIDDYNRICEDEFDGEVFCSELMSGNHRLFEKELIEFKCEDGIAIKDHYVLTPLAKQKLFVEFEPEISPYANSANTRRMKSYTNIQPKELFYNVKEREQIDRLVELLDDEKLKAVQHRLEEKGMRKGFSCLFYGAPGTGKTETALQLARLTGRDIMEVNIAGMRDKYVGDSEKNIKAVFSMYRRACKQSEKMPILLFNEADALINKRSENIEHSVDKMDNAMQNIILQEMENLEGILIATTNLTCNLDSAFDRRFLFKVEFKKPTVDVKAKIWGSMLDDLTEEDAMRLASGFDFSGGQIENIARKQSIEYILSGEKSSVDRLESYCREELLDKRQARNAIGFK